MPSFQKLASDQTGLEYDFSSPSIASASTTIFVPPANNIETKNNDVKNELARENPPSNTNPYLMYSYHIKPMHMPPYFHLS